MKHIIFYIFIFLPFSFFAQSNFSVDDIPVELKEKADAIIRIEETTFTIETINKALTKHHLVVSIFNEKGEEKYKDLKVFYDKLSKIKSLEGKLYDRNGKVIQKLKNTDIVDIGLSSFENGVSDSRLKIARFDKKNYPFPYTLEFSSLEETHNMMFYPTWNPINSEHISIEKSSFSIICPYRFLFRLKEINILKPSTISQDEKNTTQTWSIENVKPYEEEPYSPTDIHPMVFTAPVEFEVQEYHGHIQTWADVGKFYFSLNKDRDELPDNIKLKVKELTKNEIQPLKKIQKLYEYLQANTRYMSIQLGIGGWQTIKAEEVANKGYGDCKALSNYMMALLKEAGIPSCQALISAGSNSTPVYDDFPSMQFNHVITCIPLNNDTIWLECTSQTTSLGYQGDFTGNRKTLLILPEGGKLVTTTRYKPTDNLQKRSARVIIDESGNANALITTTYTGLQQDNINNVIYSLNSEEQKKWLNKNIPIPSFELRNFSFIENKGRIPKIEENLEVKINKIVNESGSRLFLAPNLMATFYNVPIIKENRKYDLFLNPNEFNFNDIDSIKYVLPTNYEIEFLPEPLKIQSQFGEYSASVSIINNNLLYYRNVIIKGDNYPAADFKTWVDFIKSIKKGDHMTVVFKKKSEK